MPKDLDLISVVRTNNLGEFSACVEIKGFSESGFAEKMADVMAQAIRTYLEISGVKIAGEVEAPSIDKAKLH